MTKPTEEILQRQVEDMYGRPTGPRHEELGARPREQDLGGPPYEESRTPAKEEPGEQAPRREAPRE